MKKKIDRSRIILIFVIVFLCAVFAVGFAWGLSGVLAMEGAYPPAENEASVIDIPDNAQKAVECLETSFAKVKNSDSGFDIDRIYAVPESSIVTDGSAVMNESARRILPKLAESLNYAHMSVDMGNNESVLGFVTNPELKTDEVTDFYSGNISYACSECGTALSYYAEKCPNCGNEKTETVADSYIYYICPSCGEERDTPADSCEKCGSTQSYSEKYGDEYNLTFEVKNDDDALLYRLFKNNTDERIIETVNTETEKTDFAMSIKSINTQCRKAYVSYGINRLTENISYIKFVRQSDVTLVVSFDGELESLGEKTVSFVIIEEYKAAFKWAAIELSDTEIAVEPKGSGNLLATLTCNDATKCEVKWTSSDENILTVDSEGYYKAGKTQGSAVITASFVFNGKTYTDSCVVNVRYSVESSKMSKRKLTLKVGESEKLSVKISPSNATIKTVKWYSTDENIVSADDEGNIKALSKGTATVYTLTDDGYYKSSCEVSVE